LPRQRGLASASGLNIPMKIWFRNVPRAFTDTGRLAAAKTLSTDWISLKISISDFSRVSAFEALWKLPPP
jgi:hypothetical protein